MKIGPHLVAVPIAVFVSAPVWALDTGVLPDAPAWVSAGERLERDPAWELSA
jgi:hypothetical protein